ncbi:MAG: ribosome silencing factor [Pseudomonadota bacterium]|jgi:ribosome-associated protein
MDIRKLQRAIVDGLEDVKAQDIAVFNTETLSAMFERVVVASGTSNRQTKALAASVRDKVRERGGRILSVEGEDNGEWIIVDCGPAVVHIMQPAIRQYYHLEEIWGTKPVRMKMGAAKTGLVKASEPSDEDDGDTTPIDAGKLPVRKRSGSAAEAKAPVRKTSTRAPKTVITSSASAPAAKKKARKPRPIEAVVRDANVPVIKIQTTRKPAAKKSASGAPARKSAPRKTTRKPTSE